MKQIISTAIAVLFIVGLLSVIVWGSKGNRQPDLPPTPASEQAGTATFFYGITCPHCADVEEWMSKNKVEEKIDIIKKEVYENRQNALELESAARSCGLSTNSIGVPFLYAGGKCTLGTPDIINYLTETIKASDATGSAERIIE